MTLTFKLNIPSGEVFEYLTNLQKFAAVHPVITKIYDLGNNNFLVHEKLRFGLSVSFTYPVKLKPDNLHQSVVMLANVGSLVKIELKFILREMGGCTIVEETQTFNSRLPIKSVLQRIFKKQHELLFKKIETDHEVQKTATGSRQKNKPIQ